METLQRGERLEKDGRQEGEQDDKEISGVQHSRQGESTTAVLHLEHHRYNGQLTVHNLYFLICVLLSLIANLLSMHVLLSDV